MIVVMTLIRVENFINIKRMNIIFEDLAIDLQAHWVEIHQKENRMKEIKIYMLRAIALARIRIFSPIHIQLWFLHSLIFFQISIEDLYHVA